MYICHPVPLSLLYVLIVTVIVTTQLSAKSCVQGAHCSVLEHTWLCNCNTERDVQDSRKLKLRDEFKMPQLSCWSCNLALLPQDLSWEWRKEETGSDGLQSEQKPGPHWSVSLPQCKQISACSWKLIPLTQLNCSTALFTGTALPRGAPSSCPGCQGLTEDNPSRWTPVFWNLRQ